MSAVWAEALSSEEGWYSVRSSDFVFLDGVSGRSLPATEGLRFRVLDRYELPGGGEVSGHGLLDSRGRGTFRSEAGEHYTITDAIAQEVPISALDSPDELPYEVQCGNDSHHHGGDEHGISTSDAVREEPLSSLPGGGGGVAQGSSSYPGVDVALLVDECVYVQRFERDNTALLDALETIMAEVDLTYRQVQLSTRLGAVILVRRGIGCQDQTTTEALQWLQNQWHQHYKPILGDTDQALLMTDADIAYLSMNSGTDRAAGAAWLGRTCLERDPLAFGITTYYPRNWGRIYPQNKIPDTISSAVIAHELGHNFSANHVMSDQHLMSARAISFSSAPFPMTSLTQGSITSHASRQSCVTAPDSSSTLAQLPFIERFDSLDTEKWDGLRVITPSFLEDLNRAGSGRVLRLTPRNGSIGQAFHFDLQTQPIDFGPVQNDGKVIQISLKVSGSGPYSLQLESRDTSSRVDESWKLLRQIDLHQVTSGDYWTPISATFYPEELGEWPQFRLRGVFPQGSGYYLDDFRVEAKSVFAYAFPASEGDVYDIADLNNDGNIDILLSAPEGGPQRNGELSVRFGPFRDRSSLSAAPDLRWIPTDPGKRLGTVLKVLHDLNGDSFPEVALANPRYPQPNNDGTVSIIDGSSLLLGAPQELFSYDGAQIFGSHGALLGQSILSVPDVDRDGIPELLIGAPGARHEDPQHGTLYGAGAVVLQLSSEGGNLRILRAEQVPSTLGGRGPSPFAAYGCTLTALPNSYSEEMDVLIGGCPSAAYQGEEYIEGRESSFRYHTVVPSYAAIGLPARYRNAGQPLGFGGSGMSLLPSINFDGRPELLVGLPSSSPTAPGKALIYQSDIFGDVERAYELQGLLSGDRFGAYTASHGEDFLVAAPGSASSRLYHYKISEGPATRNPGDRLSLLRRLVLPPHLQFGLMQEPVRFADLDSDGEQEIVVGLRDRQSCALGANRCGAIWVLDPRPMESSWRAIQSPQSHPFIRDEEIRLRGNSLETNETTVATLEVSHLQSSPHNRKQQFLLVGSALQEVDGQTVVRPDIVLPLTPQTSGRDEWPEQYYVSYGIPRLNGTPSTWYHQVIHQFHNDQWRRSNIISRSYR
ncbi:M12 family metallo-peptidase [bacterium]|nr:M12 family metallo-peptidase [bacterium]